MPNIAKYNLKTLSFISVSVYKVYLLFQFQFQFQFQIFIIPKYTQIHQRNITIRPTRRTLMNIIRFGYFFFDVARSLFTGLSTYHYDT